MSAHQVHAQGEFAGLQLLLHGVQIYLEPGEAIALNAGLLVTKVLEIVDNGMQTAILDASAACHMPDVLEMPYRPPLKGSGFAGQKKYTYRAYYGKRESSIGFIAVSE